MRAIKFVALPISEVPLRFSVGGRDQKGMITDPKMDAWWEEPALGADKQPMCWADVVLATVGWLKLTGDAFWILDDRAAFAGPIPFPEAGLTFHQFVVARPERMKPLKAQSDGSLLGWEFTDGGMRKHQLPPEQVVHLRAWNPYDDHMGAAEMEAAKNAADADYLAGRFKSNLMSANGDRGQIIGVPGANMLDDKQREQLLAQFREKRALAAQGIAKDIIVGAEGLKVESADIQQVDAGFTSVRMEDRNEIFIAFGVPPSMANVVASYSVGSASDWYRLIRDTCVPTGKTLTEAVERVLRIQRPGPRLYAWLDWSTHPVMKEVRREAVTAGADMWDRGISWETISDWMDLGLPKFPGWEKQFVSVSALPMELAGEIPDPNDPSLDEPMDEPSAEEAAISAAFAQRAPKGSKLHAKHMRLRAPAIKRYRVTFSRVLMRARVEVIGKLEASPDKSGTRAPSSGFMFNLGGFRGALNSAMRKATTVTLREAGQQLFDEVGHKDSFIMPPAKEVEFLSNRAKNLEEIPQKVFKRIQDEIDKGFQEFESMKEVADRVRSEFNAIENGLGKNIASSETAAAYGEARHEGIEMVGLTHKMWVTSGLDNVRPTHRAAGYTYGREGIPIEEAFIVGGHSLMHPGDPDGPPQEVCNCHCIEVPVKAPKEES